MKDANWTPLASGNRWLLQWGERGTVLGFVHEELECGVRIFKAYAWVDPDFDEDETFLGTFDDPRKATRAVEQVFSPSGRLARIKKALGD